MIRFSQRHNDSVNPGQDIGNVEPNSAVHARPLLSGSGYKKLRRRVVVATSLVAILPLVIMTVINYSQYEETLQSEKIQSINRLLTNNKTALEFFLSERRSALSYLGRQHQFDNLCDDNVLGRIIRDMNDSFSTSMFVDLGIIDSTGRQFCYSGPHNLRGHNYIKQFWFQRAIQQGKYTSDVFLGHRKSPHFAIVTRHNLQDDNYYLLRATFDAEALSRQIHTAGLHLDDDIFLIDRNGTLQTKSRRYGEILTKIPLALPHGSPGVEVTFHDDEYGHRIFLGYASIDDSPFVLTFVRSAYSRIEAWSVPVKLFVFLVLSSALMLAVILWGSGQFVRSLRNESKRRATLMHKVEYNNKLASIGRLAAGVAHEINNPLAIINENSGLVKDLILLEENLPNRSEFLELVDLVLDSVTRCKTITHRLLGFAKHMNIQQEIIDVPVLFKAVVGFLERETTFRNIQIETTGEEGLPNIISDRGQLQQVFLNLLNNAVSAVKDRGHIRIEMSTVDEKWVSVSIADNGVGIAKDNLKRIFEPFFTTKEGAGTGLGLSITYGIVQKLGGRISVESQLGQGTCFTVILPKEPREGKAS
ncbi:MAG: two-component sensor histidine kinase [Proteobacteria bacterium]|nr:two-component sensor histidine kinase [Pseudomonadota bacterium]